MSTVMMHNVVSVDGFIADENDDVGPLFEWYFNGDHSLTAQEMAEPEPGGMDVSKVSYDYVRPTWDAIGAMVIGRHLFDITNGWEGKPPAGEHVVVVSHRRKPEGWHPEASYHFVDDVGRRVAKAKELAGRRRHRRRGGRRRRRPGARARPGRRGRDGRRARGVRLRQEGTSGRSMVSTCSRTRTWSSRATGCCTCATGSAAERSAQQAEAAVRGPDLDRYLTSTTHCTMTSSGSFLPM